MSQYTVSNTKGATIRASAETGGGVIRTVSQGTRLNVQGIVKSKDGRDKWLLLADPDPLTTHPWRYGNVEVSVYVALYVAGVTYCVPVEGADEPAPAGMMTVAEHNRLMEQAKEFIETLKR